MSLVQSVPILQTPRAVVGVQTNVGQLLGDFPTSSLARMDYLPGLVRPVVSRHPSFLESLGVRLMDCMRI